MRIQLFAGSTHLGEIQAKVIDPLMGVVGGQLNSSGAYARYFQGFFRSHLEVPDWDELEALELRAVDESGESIEAQGGISVEDLPCFDVEVAICGVKSDIIAIISQNQ